MLDLPATTLLSLLSDLAEGSPHAQFLSEGSSSNISYRTAYILATRLIPIRLKPLLTDCQRRSQVRVALISRNNALFPLTLWALWGIGAVAVPLSASADPSLWVSMASVAHADIVLVEKNLRSKLDLALASAPSNQIDVVELESLIPSKYYEPQDQGQNVPRRFSIILACNRWASQVKLDTEQPPVEFSPSPTTPVITLFTSSAIDAATLKCVTYTHAVVLRASLRTINALGGDAYSKSPKRHLGWLPLSHCFELMISLCAIVFMTGGTYVLHDPRVSSPNLSGAEPLSVVLLESLVHHQPIQSFCTVPSILENLPEQLPSNHIAALRALESLCVGGAPSSQRLYDWAARENIAFVDYLGATEVAGGLCSRKIQQKSLDGLEAMDGLMGLLKKENLHDNVGELIVMGKNLPERYDNLESSAFTTLPYDGITAYSTGDLYGQTPGGIQRSILRGDELPRYDPSAPPLGGLYYIGRLDDVVTLNSGIKIDALGVEQLLDSLPEVRKSAVVLNAKGDGLLALIEADATTNLPQTAVTEAVTRANGHLPFEKRIRPENIQIVAALPLTTKSTVHRKKIKRILRDAGGTWPQELARVDKAQRDPPISQPAPTPIVSHTNLDSIHKELQNILSQLLSVPIRDVADPTLSFSDLGFTSLVFVRLASAVKESFAVEMKTSQLFGIRDISELCKWIVQARQEDRKPDVARQPPLPPVEPAMVDNLAITGASCRFPNGIDSLASFWDALVSSQEFSSAVPRPAPASRWASTHNLDLPSMGWLEGMERDDLFSFASFFELRPLDVKAMPPNARIALKMAYNAIEDAGIAPKSLDGKSWGIFSSVNDSGWRERRLAEVGLEEYGKTWGGVADDAVGARLSYFLNLTGPAVEVKTACSSSAVAVHQACMAIRNGDCEAAIVVCATTHFFPAGSVFRKSAGIASHLGRCATFSQDADGFLPSEGAAAIVIQKSQHARGEIYAHIKGSAVTQDGRSQGFSAPNPLAQTRLINMALHRSGLGPNDLSYLETHGTGTRLGDAIEIQALNQVFGFRRTRPLPIGAVKAVIGHTEECAGLAGIIKGLLCFHHNAIPPQANFRTVNEELDLFESKLIIPRRVTSFVEQRSTRFIGISSFGLSGTLAHIILQEAPQHEPDAVASPNGGIFVVSGRSPTDLAASITSWLAYMDSPLSRESYLEDICFTTQLARDAFAYRYAWPVSNYKELLSRLQQAATSNSPLRAPRHPKISIWFGAPPSTRRSLPSIDHSTFHRVMSECTDASHGIISEDLKYYAVQLALARTLVSIGCKIVAVGGEGPGELVAAAFAGVFDISSLFALLSEMEAPSGHEAATFEASDTVIMERLLNFGPHQLRVRAEHGGGQTTIIGTTEAMGGFRVLNPDLVCIGLHDTLNLRSRHTVPLSLAQGHFPIVSAHVGRILGDELLLSMEYWNGILDRQVNGQVAWRMLSERSDFSINLGGAELAPRNVVSTHSMDKYYSSRGEPSKNAFLARLFEAGCDLDWKSLGTRGRIVHIPTYQWGVGDR